MKESNNFKNKWLHLRLSEAEHRQIQKAFSKSGEEQISTFARTLLLGEPLITGYRNESEQELVQLFGKLLKTLNGIANNYGQMQKKLRTFADDPQVLAWLEINQNTSDLLLTTIQEIKADMAKIAASWLL